jgi:HEAT repeat protein
MQENHVPYLIAQLKHNDNAPYSRRIARDALVSMGSQIIPPLVEGLNTDNLWILSGILEVLGEIGGTDEISIIMPFLDWPEVMVVRRAVMALAKISDPRPIPRIIDLMEDANWHIKSIAADGLYHFFQHDALKDMLYTELLKAFFERGNREDYLVFKFDEVAWNVPTLEADPMHLIRFILARIEMTPMEFTDLVYLRYFYQKSIQLLELRLNGEISQDYRSRLLQVHKSLLEKGQIAVTEQYNIVI